MDSRSPRCCGRRTRTPARTPSCGSSAPERLGSEGRSGTTRTSWAPRTRGLPRAGRDTRSGSAAKRCGCANKASSRGSSAAAAGTSTRTWLRFWPSWATPTARGRRSCRRISPRARPVSPPRARRGSRSPAAGGCSNCRPRIRSAWQRGRRRARFRRTSTCTSTTRTCCRRKRRAALAWALVVLGRRCEVTDLDRLREASNGLSQRDFALN